MGRPACLFRLIVLMLVTGSLGSPSVSLNKVFTSTCSLIRALSLALTQSLATSHPAAIPCINLSPSFCSVLLGILVSLAEHSTAFPGPTLPRLSANTRSQLRWKQA